jgi:tRNA A-37 threonylcarbamoyl transferase component Bud32/TolA-binding protein
MGVVYQAEDLKLARQVALKFLAPDRIHDRAMAERFVREARTASALNHPNICTIYEVDEHDGRQFIAMELLEGEPLDRRIGGRPLGMSAVVDLGIQIADALSVAHEQGILHRDIKPGNIFITARGQAKILDFGLAKLLDPGRNASQGDDSVTYMPTDLLTTKQGTALGTIAYMSPEQARGETLDARTDLFSFGLVLYEMATGQRTFEGNTTAVVFDAILNREPRAPIEINANIPLSLERVIGRCLQKDRDLRFGTAAEIRLALEDVRRERESMTSSRPVSAAQSGMAAGTTWPSGSTAVDVAPSPPAAKRAGWYGSLTMAAIGVAALGGAAFLVLRTPQVTAPEPGAETRTATVGTTGEPAAPVPPASAAAAPVATAQAAAAPAPVVKAAAPGNNSGLPSPASASAAPLAATAPGASAGSGRRGSEVIPANDAAAAALKAAGAKSATDPGADVLRIARAKFEARLLDQALADAESLVTRYASSASAPDAFLLMGQIRERQNRPDDAMAAYVELRSRHPSSPAAAEAAYRNADLLLRSRRDDRDKAALDLFSSIGSTHPSSPFAPHALAKQAALEQKLRLRVADEQLGTTVPAQLVSYRSIVQRYPTASVAEAAHESLAKLYEEQRRYDLAAATLLDLATRFPANRIDAAWRAGEMYEERVKDQGRARESYALVPPQSSRYRDAQRKLQPRS